MNVVMTMILRITLLMNQEKNTTNSLFLMLTCYKIASSNEKQNWGKKIKAVLHSLLFSPNITYI